MDRRTKERLRPHKTPCNVGLRGTMVKLNDEEIKIIEKLPQVLAIQKKKLLIAINEAGDGGTENTSPEEEQLVKEVSESLAKLACFLGPRQSRQWNDSEATMYVKKKLQENGHFELSRYLACAKVVCLYFCDKKNDASTTTSNAMEYLLTHARQFGNPTKTIFQTEPSTKQVPQPRIGFLQGVSQQKSQNLIVRRVAQLIAELKEAYDETKFQALNVQVTSFSLLIMRRIMKQDSKTIRFIIFRSCICLVIEAYLKSEDEKTKKSLRDTCIKYMEWYDMQLPGMFFKMADLYGMDAGQVWDLLTSVKSRKTNKSQIDLATVYYNNYQLSRNDPSKSQRWLAFCRLFGAEYHRDLSNGANVNICVLLGMLLERKNPLGERAHKYICLDKADLVKEWAKPIAEELFTKINK